MVYSLDSGKSLTGLPDKSRINSFGSSFSTWMAFRS